jgi:hypothetical protein
MLSNLLSELLSALVVYGLPLLFVVVLIASAGVPLPATLVTVAAGAFAQDGIPRADTRRRDVTTIPVERL